MHLYGTRDSQIRDDPYAFWLLLRQTHRMSEVVERLIQSARRHTDQRAFMQESGADMHYVARAVNDACAACPSPSHSQDVKMSTRRFFRMISTCLSANTNVAVAVA